MFQYTLRDESNHIALGRYILSQLIAENPDLWTSEFKIKLVSFMREGVGKRIWSLGLPMLSAVKVNPFTRLDEVISLRKEMNFFETRVTEYQTSNSVKNSNEEDLI